MQHKLSPWNSGISSSSVSSSGFLIQSFWEGGTLAWRDPKRWGAAAAAALLLFSLS